MVLRLPALVGMACGAAIAAGALAGCQNGATSEPTVQHRRDRRSGEKVPPRSRTVLLVGITRAT